MLKQILLVLAAFLLGLLVCLSLGGQIDRARISSTRTPGLNDLEDCEVYEPPPSEDTVRVQATQVGGGELAGDGDATSFEVELELRDWPGSRVTKYNLGYAKGRSNKLESFDCELKPDRCYVLKMDWEQASEEPPGNGDRWKVAIYERRWFGEGDSRELRDVDLHREIYLEGSEGKMRKSRWNLLIDRKSIETPKGSSQKGIRVRLTEGWKYNPFKDFQAQFFIWVE